MNRGRSRQVPSWVFLAVASMLMVGIAASGALYYLSQREAHLTQVRNELASIADLKVGQITAWRQERIGDARVVFESSFFIEQFADWIADPSQGELRQALEDWMESRRIHYDYYSVLVVDGAGGVLLASPADAEPLGDQARELLQETLQAGDVVVSDLYLEGACPSAHLDLFIPLPKGQESSSAGVGAIVLRVDPGDYLYPLVQTWPTPSETAETLLVRREGDQVLYLNDLRHVPGSALRMRLPMGAPNLPAAMGLLGTTGVVEGADYRDIPVLAALRPIPETPWVMVAKIDLQEVNAPLVQRGRMVGGLVAALLLAGSTSIGWLWRQDRAGAERRWYEAELERKALVEHYGYLSKYANDAIFLADEDGALVEINDRGLSLYGYARGELLGKHVQDLRSPETRPGFSDSLRQLAERNGLVYETVHRRKDGETFPVEISARLIQIEGRRFYQGIVRDITDRRRVEEALEESEERFRATFEQAAVGVTQVSPEGKFLRINRRFCEIVGYSQEESQSLTFQEITHPDDLEADLSQMHQLLAGEISAYSMEKRYIRKDGCPIWINLTVSVVRQPGGEPKYLIGVSEDITARKEAEEAIRQLNERLEQRVVERTAQLEAANRELESFSYSVSHDLRAPLRAIDGFSRILLEEHLDRLDQEGRRYLHMVQANTMQMGRLIDDLLAFSRLSRQGVRWASVDMKELVHHTYADLHAEEPGRTIEFAVVDLPPCRGDAALLKQVWMNLLSNALKFTRRREVSIIQVGAQETDGHPVYFVRDNGVGFDMRYADKLFGVFQRLHADEDFEGTGVGLAIVQRIIRRHGGQVWAQAAVDQGATFFFTVGEETVDEHVTR